MAGLDNVIANGLNGFLLLEDVVTSLTDAKLRRALLRQLEQSKRYLKIGYRMHCETRCISFALSDKKFENLQPNHDHNHTKTCHQCALLLSTTEAIGNLLRSFKGSRRERRIDAWCKYGKVQYFLMDGPYCQKCATGKGKSTCHAVTISYNKTG